MGRLSEGGSREEMSVAFMTGEFWAGDCWVAGLLGYWVLASWLAE